MLSGFLGEKSLEMNSKEREKRACERGIMNEMVEATSPCGKNLRGMVMLGTARWWLAQTPPGGSAVLGVSDDGPCCL